MARNSGPLILPPRSGQALADRISDTLCYSLAQETRATSKKPSDTQSDLFPSSTRGFERRTHSGTNWERASRVQGTPGCPTAAGPAGCRGRSAALAEIYGARGPSYQAARLTTLPARSHLTPVLVALGAWLRKPQTSPTCRGRGPHRARARLRSRAGGPVLGLAGGAAVKRGRSRSPPSPELLPPSVPPPPHVLSPPSGTRRVLWLLGRCRRAVAERGARWGP